MTKIYILALTIISFSLFSQKNKDYTRYYNSWRLGLNVGTSWQTSDVRCKFGEAAGFTLERGFGENETNFFSFAIRGRYLGANTYGMGTTRNYNVQSNDAYNGLQNPAVNYYDSMSVNRRYIFDNHKTRIKEGSIELQVTFNRLRAQTHVLLNLWGGIGITSYRTFVNLQNEKSKMYDFSKLDSTGNESKVISSYNTIIDNSYESTALGSKRGETMTFSPSGGVGLGYQFSPGFSMLFEYKVTVPQGLNADLLDGKINNNTDNLNGNNDYYHYAGLNLLFTLRGKKKKEEPVKKDDVNNYTTTVPVNTVIPTNSVTATTPTVINNNNTQQLPKPIISYINPPVNGQVTNNSQYGISAQILNIDNANQIKFYVNSTQISNFTFNSSTHLLNYTSTLNIGTNPIQIIATNASGSDNKSTSVVYELPKQPINNPPTVEITNPRNCPFTSSTQQFNLIANTSYITNINQVVVKINNVSTTNFSFDANTGQISLPLNLVNGNNNVFISVTNSFGNDVASCNITYSPQQQVALPLITILNPPQSGYVSSTQNYVVNATIINVPASSNISLYCNGVSTPFSYNVNTKQFSFTANLNEGANSVAISAYNSAGEDNKTTSIVYHAPLQQGNPPTVIITNPRNCPFTSSVEQYNLIANTTYITNKNQITVKVNNNVTSNFTYDANIGQISLPLNLVNGYNDIAISVANNYGNANTNCSIIYNAQQGVKLPIITIVTPPQAGYVSANQNYVVNAAIINVPSSNNISLYYNGISTPFSYNIATKQFSFTANLNEGANSVAISAYNSAGEDNKTTSIVYHAPVQQGNPPVVSLISPNQITSNNATPLYHFKFTVLNVSSKNDITLTYNGNSVTNFIYNSINKEVLFDDYLVSGTNTLTVKGTNTYGNDSKTVFVNFQPRVITVKNPPKVTFIAPLSSPGNGITSTYDFKANITHVSNSSGLVVKYNGTILSNYTYNGSLLTYNALLNGGNNTLEITASNTDGSDVASAIVNHKVKTISNPPVVSLANPLQASSTTTNVIYNFSMSVINVASKNDVEVTFNGVLQSNFNYHASSTMVDFTSNLQVGNNTFTVKGTNADGSDSKTVNIIYEPIIVTKKPPVVTFILPSANTTSVSNSSYVYKATITNVPNSSGLLVKFNGNVISNYNYNGSIIDYSASLISGSNSLEIIATNADGSDSKTATVNYKPIVITRPPVVSIINPAVNTPTVNSSVYVFNFTAMNASQNQVNINLNNNSITNFSFVGINGTFTQNLVNGLNTIVVSATNNDGSDSRTAHVYYQAPVNNTVEIIDTTGQKITVCLKLSVKSSRTLVIPINQLEDYLKLGATIGSCDNSSPSDTIGKKVTICHIPPGNNQNPQTITIPMSALPAHIAHGDHIGKCPTSKKAEPIKSSGTIKFNTGQITNPIKTTTENAIDTAKKVITQPINTIKRPR